MAKKIIFEGVVNGEVFHSVEEYNAAVQKAIEAGGALECQSTTKAVDEPEEVVLMTPFFEALDQSYITHLLTVDNLEDELQDALDTVRHNIHQVEDMEDYKDAVSKVQDQINEDFVATRDAINELENKLEKLHKGLTIIQETNSLYDEIVDVIKEEEDNRQKAAAVAVEEKQAPVQGAPISDSQANDVAAGVRRLLKAIGLDVDELNK